MNGMLRLVALPLRPVAAVARVTFPALVRPLVAAVLDAVDVTALIREHVDLDELARQVIDELDLPRIMRDSTGTLASETVRGMRAECARADDAVAGLVDRVLRRSPADRP